MFTDRDFNLEILEVETELLMREPGGAGMDGSAWLLALEHEFEQVNYSSDLAAQSHSEKTGTVCHVFCTAFCTEGPAIVRAG